MSSRTPPEDRQTSATILEMVRRGVAQQIPGVVDPDADKTTHLRALLASAGPGAILKLGLGLRRLPDNPVFAAITAGRDAVAVLQRWMRLERFGHSRNRTRLLEFEADVARPHATLQHIAVDGGPIHAVNDLFVWGLLIAVLQRAGYRDVGAYWADSCEPGTAHCDPSALWDGTTLPARTHTVRLTWTPARAAPTPAPQAELAASRATALPALLRSDPLRKWRLRDAAHTLAVSPRQLQRLLRLEGTSFSEALHRARVDVAQARMPDRRLTLTEIAFCAGFSDLAHLSRVFRRYLEVPPSALRELLLDRDDVRGPGRPPARGPHA